MSAYTVPGPHVSNELLPILQTATKLDLALYGFLLVPIVGIRHYEGATSLKHGVWVTLVPEPTNAYDCNAIRVDRKDGTNVGYVGRGYAKKIQSVYSKTLFNRVQVKCVAVDSPDVYEVWSVVAFYGPETDKGVVLPALKELLGGGMWFPVVIKEAKDV